MAYEFKKLSDVEVVAEPTETANVLIEEDGVIKKAPKTAVGGAKEEWDAVIEDIRTDDTTSITLLSGSYQAVYDKIMAGEPAKVLMKYAHQYGSICYGVHEPTYCNVVASDTPFIYINYRSYQGTNYYVQFNSDNTVVQD